MDQTARDYQSVISQLVAAVWGRGWVYYITIASVLAVLALSANTSFIGFPRLCRQVAGDSYLPKAFAIPGRRLVYTAGIVFLALGAGALLTLFDGITDRLIPLFAVGAFLSFTLSQAGMAMHWWRTGAGHRDRARMLVNGLGAAATGLALAIILVAKFTDGAWLTMLVIPLTLLLLRLVHRYYRALEHQVLVGSRKCMEFTGHAPPVALIPIERWDRLAERAVQTAACLSPDVVALHLTDLEGPDAEEHQTRLRRDGDRFVGTPAAAAGLPEPQLVIRSSPYRSLLAPLLREVATIQARCPRRPVVVLLNEFTGGHWWEAFLHTRRSHRLRTQVLRHAGPGVSVLMVPWQQTVDTAGFLLEEEPQRA